MLTTNLLPLPKAVATIGASVILTGGLFEYFLKTHATPASYSSATWRAAAHDAADGHTHRVASPVDVELNPARRLREHEKEARASRQMHVPAGQHNVPPGPLHGPLVQHVEDDHLFEFLVFVGMEGLKAWRDRGMEGSMV